MNKKILVLFLLVLLPLSVSAADDEEKTKLAKFISKLGNIPLEAITVESIKDSDLIKGGKEATVRLRNNPNPVMLYLVGEKIIIGSVYDRNYDPYAENMKKISIKDRPTRGNGPVVLAEYSEFQ